MSNQRKRQRNMVKTKRFGRVHAMSYIENFGPEKPGVSINLDNDYVGEDEFAGQWLRIPEAKKLLISLGKAIEYVERISQLTESADAK